MLYLEPELLPSGAAEAAALSPTLEAAGIRQMTRRIHAALDSPHPSHLVRVFSRTYGMAPHQYLIGRRVDLARRLLADRHTAADAANLSGFHDQSHMTRHFRRILGITPGALTS